MLRKIELDAVPVNKLDVVSGSNRMPLILSSVARHLPSGTIRFDGSRVFSWLSGHRVSNTNRFSKRQWRDQTTSCFDGVYHRAHTAWTLTWSAYIPVVCRHKPHIDCGRLCNLHSNDLFVGRFMFHSTLWIEVIWCWATRVCWATKKL